MLECMKNAAREHMTLDEQISFCEEKSKNIKLKAEPQTFVDIKNSLEKLKNPWIPVEYHVMTEEERKAGGFSKDIVYYLDCKMPDDEQEIIATNGKYVWVDTCIVNDGFALDSGNDWIEDVVAWMPMPEPYRESEE